jgi:spore germination protein GerM
MRRVLLPTLVTGCILVCLLTSCGLPGEQRSEVLTTDNVPYDLLQAPPTDAGSATPQRPVPENGTRLYWVTSDDVLVPAPAQAPSGTSPDETAQALLAELAAGPPEVQRARGRGTNLVPGARLQLSALDESGTAVVALGLEGTVTEADRLPAAIGQIVLTLTSVDGLTWVRFTDGDGPLEVPLPGGALTEAPVSRDDYRSLVRQRP